MSFKRVLLSLALCYFGVQRSDGYVEAIGANIDVSQTGPETQVAMACDKSGARYHNQYLDASGHWVSDLEHKKGCMKSKVDILNYCRLMYPNTEFVDSMEAAHSYMIDDWCKIGHHKCKESFWVKPYRCLQGTVASNPLFVPETCRFDHMQDESQCLDDHGWSRIANESCREHGMKLNSFLTKHSCGTEVHNGVEFVCCPKNSKKAHKKGFNLEQTSVTDESMGEITSEPDTDETSTRDPYFTKFDPRIEHDAFRAAERRLEAAHRQKITKIMKEWTDLEEKYQKIKTKSPQKANKFKLRMTERFNKMMNALKDQGAAEKHQLVDLHQQRIIAHINERKKDGMKCFVKSLNEHPPSSAQVQKCLNHLIRALYKDRHHTISHFNHLLLTRPDSAQEQRAATIEHLRDIERMTNESMQMLDRFPDMKVDILPEISQLVAELRVRDALPAQLTEPVTSAPTAAPEVADDDVPIADHNQAEIDNRIDIDVEVERQPAAAAAVPERLPEPLPAHSRQHEHVQSEADFEVVGVTSSPGSGRGLYVTVALASLALAVALMATLLSVRRRQRAPQRHGFIEVDQTITPEERHLASMQVNGYENPTYRYFESK